MWTWSKIRTMNLITLMSRLTDCTFTTKIYSKAEIQGKYINLYVHTWICSDLSNIILFCSKIVHFGQTYLECEYCQDEVWYEERAKKTKTTNKADFSLCCQKGKVQLPLLQQPPFLLQNVLNGSDDRSRIFLQNIRIYNNMFSFTSIGRYTSVNNGYAPPQFILNGQNYHYIGSLLPQDGLKPKFAQLYIYDTENEINNRMKHFRLANICFMLL